MPGRAGSSSSSGSAASSGGTASPFGVTLYDGAFKKLGMVGAPTSITAVLRHNGIDTLQLAVTGSSPRLEDLLRDDCRVVVTFDGKFLMSGRKVTHEGAGPSSASRWTFFFNGDEALLSSLLAWPTPGAALTAQTSEYDTRGPAPAETVLKGVVSANLPRIQGAGKAPVAVAANQARGGNITVANRFHPIADRTMAAFDGSGLGVTVRQAADGSPQAPGLVLDVYPERVYPRTLTEDSKAISGWKATWKAPTATREVVGGKGEGTARAFSSVVDTAAEANLRYAVEGFLDATDTDTDAQRVARGQASLADDAGAQVGLQVTLAQTDTYRFDPAPPPSSSRLGLGDVVTLAVGPRLRSGGWLTVTDRITTVSLSWSTSSSGGGSGGGLQITPQVGDVNLSAQAADRISRGLASVSRAIRTLSAR